MPRIGDEQKGTEAMYSEQNDVAEQVRALMRHLGLKGGIGDREALEHALDNLKETALRDFDQGEFWGRRRNEIWMNRSKIISALGELALSDYRPSETFEWSEIRAAELRPGMFVERRRQGYVSPEEPYGRRRELLVVIYAQPYGTPVSGDYSLYMECVPVASEPDGCHLSMSGGVFTPGTIVRAALGVADRVDPPKDRSASGEGP
jgi:hypothetical protein